MLDLLLTANDISVTAGDVSMVTGADQVKQSIVIALRLFLGEWFDNLDAGMPYYQQILDTAPTYDGTGRQAPSARIVESIFRKHILDVDGVEAITAFDLDLERATRHATITFTCQTSEGVIEVSEVFP